MVDDFQKAIDLFNAAGLKYKSFQESKRESWRLRDVEIVLDLWPWLNPYLEIEGPKIDALKDVARKLDLKWEDAVFGDVMAAYRVQYPHLTRADTVTSLPDVKFNDPLPRFLSRDL